MKNKVIKLFVATLASAFGMWVLAGLWHNLVLPSVNENIHPHHEGIGLLLIAYIILGFFMTYIYSLVHKKSKTVLEGIKIGVIIGIVWEFQHGLAMAGTHSTSVLYEIKNTLWHIFEQGIGGIIIASIIKAKKK